MPTGYEDEDTDDDGSLIRDLRSQIKSLRAERDQAVEEATTFRQKARESTVSEILEARGVKSGISKFIPDDVEGAEAVNAWLEENAELFGITVDSEATAPVDAETAQESKRLQSLSSAAITPGKVTDLTTRLESAETDSEVDAIWAEAQQYVL